MMDLPVKDVKKTAGVKSGHLKGEKKKSLK